MKIKSDSIEFISFSDGKCDIYTEDDSGGKSNKYIGLGFSNYVLGVKRYWAAAANQVKINKVIRIPLLRDIDTFDTVEIKGMGKYEVKEIQEIYDTNPPCITLSLKAQ